MKMFGRLDVPVDDPFAVSGIQGIGNLNPQLEQFLCFHGLALDALLQGLPLQKLHDDKGLAFMIPDVVNDTDMGMVEGRSRPGLSLKPFQGLPVLGELLGQKLQGHVAAEAGVLGLVDHTHAPAAQFLDDFVVGNSLANHELGIGQSLKAEGFKGKEKSGSRRSRRPV